MANADGSLRKSAASKVMMLLVLMLLLFLLLLLRLMLLLLTARAACDAVVRADTLEICDAKGLGRLWRFLN